jgi:protein gp37
MRTAPSNWAKPLAWNAKAAASGKPWRVFCASLADVFDNEVPEVWRADLWRLIRATPALTWLLLTKRIGNVAKMHPGGHYENVWIGATIVNAEEAERDVPKLLAVEGVAKRFVSYEPALGPVDWTTYPGIDWIIVGGESMQGGKARPFDLQWAYHTIGDAEQIGAAPFVKQLGSCNGYKDRAGADTAEWPVGLRVQRFPSAPVQNPAND